MLTFPVIIIALIVLYLLSAIKILREYERGVIFRLGRVLSKPKGPGLIFVFPPIDRMVRVSLRIVVMDIPPQDVITKDNVSVKVNAVLYFRVMDPISRPRSPRFSLCHFTTCTDNITEYTGLG
jgi:regulator of protease activity HflC (stomatin/prohibitin superfamily)